VKFVVVLRFVVAGKAYVMISRKPIGFHTFIVGTLRFRSENDMFYVFGILERSVVSATSLAVVSSPPPQIDS